MRGSAATPAGARALTLLPAAPAPQVNRDATVASPKALPTGRARVVLLYEEYVHLPLLREVGVGVLCGAVTSPASAQRRRVREHAAPSPAQPATHLLCVRLPL